MKECREKPVPLTNTKLRRAIGVVRLLHGLWGRSERSLLGVAQGREAPSHKDFEKNALLCSHGPAVGLHEGEELVRRCNRHEQGKRVWREQEEARAVFVDLLLAVSLQPAALDQPADKKKTKKFAMGVQE